MTCVCGHNKTEHLSGRDYGRNAWKCSHRQVNEDGSIQHCNKSCAEYTKKVNT